MGMRCLDRRTLVIAVVLAAFGLAGPLRAEAADKKLKMALCLPGAISDKGFNAAAHAGLMRVKEDLGHEVAFTENVQRTDFVTTLRDYASRGYDVIIAHGFQWGDAIQRVAKDFPDKKFVNTFGAVTGSNLASTDIVVEELFHVTGAVAAWVTKSKKVGVVGGWEIPPIRRQAEAFRLGVVGTDPKVDVRTTFVGTFYDPVKGKEAATALIGAGVDVITHMADASGLGVLEAARERKVLAIGYQGDQLDLAPQVVLTSNLVNTGEMIKQMVDRVAKGTFEGKLNDFGLASGVLRLGRWGEAAAPDVRARAERLAEDIKMGKVTIPKVDMKALMQKKP